MSLLSPLPARKCKLPIFFGAGEVLVKNQKNAVTRRNSSRPAIPAASGKSTATRSIPGFIKTHRPDRRLRHTLGRVVSASPCPAVTRYDRL